MEANRQQQPARRRSELPPKARLEPIAPGGAAHTLLGLQRTLGNQAVQRLFVQRYPPDEEELRTDLADYARDILGPSRLDKAGLFDGGYVAAKLEEHLTGRQKNNKLLFSLIMFQEWYERHVA